MFRDFTNYEDDSIEGLFVRLARDNSDEKIDLGIGVYRDDTGQVPVMQAVRHAERAIVARNTPKSYLTPFGNMDYCRDIELLVLGADHPTLTAERIVSAQTPGAGSALRLAAELVHGISPSSRVWLSEPVWFHQTEFFEKAGMELRTYRYYDQQNSVLRFEEMLQDLSQMQPDDVLLLHGCCHNPTGQDLDLEQWQAITDIVLQTGAIPFIDIAYQGFGKGIDDDAAGLRLIAGQVPQALLAVSSSKSFGVYRERAGLLSIITPPDAVDLTSIRRKFRDTARQLYFMAPDHGAAIIHEILSTPELEELWRQELNSLRHNIVAKRSALRATIEAENAGFDGAFIEKQLGMFSCLPISSDEQRALEDEFHIYMLPDARVNVAAMNADQATILASAFRTVRERR